MLTATYVVYTNQHNEWSSIPWQVESTFRDALHGTADHSAAAIRPDSVRTPEWPISVRTPVRPVSIRTPVRSIPVAAKSGPLESCLRYPHTQTEFLNYLKGAFLRIKFFLFNKHDTLDASQHPKGMTGNEMVLVHIIVVCLKGL